MTEDFDNQVATLKELARLQKKAASGSLSVASDLPLHDTLSQRKVPHTMAITSGKGGVGKTLVTVNLAVHYARKGLKVLLIDADLGLANIDVVGSITAIKPSSYWYYRNTVLANIDKKLG